MTTRKELLKQATDAVCTDREGQYGSPEDNFRRIADLWTTYCGGYNFEPKDVAMMMSLLKIARIATGKHKDDNYIDLAGYAACGAELGSLETAHEAVRESEPDEVEIAIYICADDDSDDSESDKEYIKRLSQTVSNLTEELERVKDEKSEAHNMWKKTYDEMVRHYEDDINVLKDKNRTLYDDKLKAVEDYVKATEVVEDYIKATEEIDKLKDEITKLRIDRDMLKDTCEHLMAENKELKTIRDDVTSELLRERAEKESLQDAMDILRADRHRWIEKYKNLTATVTGKDTDNEKL